MKKIAVLLPVFILALFYFKARYHEEYAVAGLRGKASLAFGVCIMFFVMILGVYKKKQETFLQGFIQSSFLVYVFMVLTLTGYFILFREIAAHGWWHRVLHRVQTKERINLQPFLMFKQFQLASTQVIGNLVDAVVISTPDHWHALMTMMACAAGKDVYVEKPLTLFVREGRWMIDVARKHKRVVQVGTQQRSGPHYQQSPRADPRAATSARSSRCGCRRTATSCPASASPPDGAAARRARLGHVARPRARAAVQPATAASTTSAGSGTTPAAR